MRSHFNLVVAITDSNQLNKCNRGNRLNQHRKNPFPISVGNLVRISIGNLRAMRLLNNSQQVRSNFAISLHLFIGVSSVVLCKTLRFFCKVLQTLGESTEQRVFSGFEGDRDRALAPQSGRESIPCLIAQVL